MPRPTRFSPGVRARAVRMVMEHEAVHDSQWAAITSIAEKIGCTAERALCGLGTAEALLRRGSRGLQIAAVGFFTKEEELRPA